MKKLLLVLIASMTTAYVVAAAEVDYQSSAGVLTAGECATLTGSSTPRDTTGHDTRPSILKRGHCADQFRKRSLSEDNFTNTGRPRAKKIADYSPSSTPLYPALHDGHGQPSEEEPLSGQTTDDNLIPSPSTAPEDQGFEQNQSKQQVDLPIPPGINTGLQVNSPLYRIIGVSTAAALLGAGTVAFYNKVAKKQVSKARVAAVLWLGTAVTLACYYYGPTLCPCLFGGAEE